LNNFDGDYGGIFSLQSRIRGDKESIAVMVEWGQIIPKQGFGGRMGENPAQAPAAKDIEFQAMWSRNSDLKILTSDVEKTRRGWGFGEPRSGFKSLSQLCEGQHMCGSSRPGEAT